ncbi:hypothetical protein EYF80_046377 [Liparis tanakae]|uniref:Uncharacterized protein n=1 Tax=Liparis tanakae TaxID=230148 RepID=A0A4Z2FQN2_9TELE|nr:hypothetical protein EYF80_046377 [Liparis tanakae]
MAAPDERKREHDGKGLHTERKTKIPLLPCALGAAALGMRLTQPRSHRDRKIPPKKEKRYPKFVYHPEAEAERSFSAFTTWLRSSMSL